MVLWQCELRVSWSAQWQSLLLHGAIILLLLLLPWPGSYTPVWVALLTLAVMECVRSQRRILSRAGPVALLDNGQLRWRHKHWLVTGRPWIGRRMILLSLRNGEGDREKLWLFIDAMAPDEWRLLRQQLLLRRDIGHE